MNDASLALWLTLDNASWDDTTTPALTALAVRQLSHPDVRPGFEFANRSLIQLASKCSAFPWHGRALPADAPWPPTWTLVTQLLDKGADPWAPLWEDRRDPSNESNVLPQAGLMPFIHLLACRAWPLLDLLLRHPSRPTWETIFAETNFGTAPVLASLDAHPEMLDLLLRHGLDPNLRLSEVPLVFRVKAIETAQRLVAAGADPSVTSDAGLSMLEHREHEATSRYRPMSADDRAGWTQLMGHALVKPAEVFATAMQGSVPRLRALFKHLRDVKAWTWQPDAGVPLTVLDGALYGQFTDPSCGAAVTNLFAKSKRSPITPEQADLVWLSAALSTPPDTQDPAVGERLVRALGALLALDRRFLKLDSVDTSNSAPYFSPMSTLFKNIMSHPLGAHAHPLLDRWMEWLGNDSRRWGPLSPLVAKDAVFPLDAAAPRHRVALWGHRLLDALNDWPAAADKFSQEKAVARGQVEQAFEHMMAAHDEAGSTFPDQAWADLWEAIRVTPEIGDDLCRRRQARTRADHGAERAPSIPSRPRLRS